MKELRICNAANYFYRKKTFSFPVPPISFKIN